jgi:O-antigen/teichoic acid export membrane protein
VVPAIANLALCLWLIPRFGLAGAVWATATSYATGLAASVVLGRRALRLPFPFAEIARVALATAGMGLVVHALPAVGGVAELALKAAVGALAYGAFALALDVGGLRARAAGLATQLRTRTAT